MLLTEQELLERIDDMVKVSRAFAQQKLTNKSRLRLQKSMEMMFKAQQKIVLKQFAKLQDMFEEAIKPSDLNSIYMIAEDKTHTAAEKAMNKAARDGLLKGSKALISELNVGMSFTLANPAAVDYLERFGAKKVTQINDSTRKYINGIVKQSADEGWSYGRTAKAIGERYNDMWIGKPQQHIASRAHFIAVTEAGNAYMEGQLAVVNDLSAAGLEMEKYWSTMRDDRVSDGCIENEDAGWISGKKNFPSGHQRPLRFPGCRCDMLSRVAEDKVLTGEPPPMMEFQAAPEQFLSSSQYPINDYRTIRAAKEAGISPEEYVRQCEIKLQKYVDDNPISVRADAHNAMSIIDDGHFKTQFETNSTNGLLDKGYRKDNERLGLGIPDNVELSKRPIYGYVSNPEYQGVTDMYGPVEFVLKDTVKSRTTISAGDSLGQFDQGWMTGTPANNVTKAGLDAKTNYIFEGQWPSGSHKFEFIEAQIQGGLKIADVDHLILHNLDLALDKDQVAHLLKWFGDKGFQVIYVE